MAGRQTSVQESALAAAGIARRPRRAVAGHRRAAVVPKGIRFNRGSHASNRPAAPGSMGRVGNRRGVLSEHASRPAKPVPQQDRRSADVLRFHGASDYRRVRPVPHAQPIRAVRTDADVRSALRYAADRSFHRRAGGHRRQYNSANPGRQLRQRVRV